MPLNEFPPMAPDLEKQYSVTPAVARSTHSTVMYTSGATNMRMAASQVKDRMKGRKRPHTTSARHAIIMSPT